MRFLLLLILISNFGTIVSGNSDWPMWRNDPGRRAFAEINLPDNPSLLWTRQLEEPKRCWPFQFEDYFSGGNPDQIGKLSFDISYEPVVGDGRLFVPSMVSDRLTAYLADTGEELWRYYVGGPVRFAPVYDSGRVYFVSDDGFLYCLDAATGELLWNYHGSYSDRLVLGNERVISMWPARGGPVISNGIIYFASGVMPFEGTFIHAVDAESGEKVWTNSISGSMWSLHQHGGAYSYGGPSPQGYLSISGGKLIVPGGRTPPAVYDINTGEFLYFNQATGNVGKGAGGYRVFASGDWFFNHGMLYAIEDGAQFGHLPGDVITDDAFIGISGSNLVAHRSYIKKEEVEIEDRLQRGAIKKMYEVEKLWETEVDGIDRIYLKTGSHMILSKNGGNTAALVALSGDGRPGDMVWEHTIDDEIWSMFAADGKLYIVTRKGKIYCFGAEAPGQPVHHIYEPEIYHQDTKSKQLANSIIESTGVNGGYGIVYGGENSGLIKALVKGTSMHLVIVEPDEEKVEVLRRDFDDAGLYGKRVSVMRSDLNRFPSLPYVFDLILLEGGDWSGDQFMKVFNSLRPYGGSAFFIGAGSDLEETFSKVTLENGKFIMERDFAMIIRQGALPGSAQWTHQYGGASNRAYSDDDLVKPPLGVLWFGGPSNLNALPRHGYGPVPQVAGGKLLILGVETLSARCVYTGRELWVREIPGIGHPFTNLELEEEFASGQEVFMYNQIESSGKTGASFIGSPYVSLEDAVYVIDRNRLLSLEPATGEIKTEFRLPPINGIQTREFGHIMVSGNYLITTIDPQIFDDDQPGKENNWNATSSSVLLVMDRHNGNVLWTMRAKKGFRHNAIVAGTDRLFLVDGLSEGVVEILQRRGLFDEKSSELMALDLKTGKELWSLNENVFGTWLGLYEDKDILIQAGRYAERHLNLEDEPRNPMVAHRGETGEVLWVYNQDYKGPVCLHPDMIILAPGQSTRIAGESPVEPETGNILRKEHPITGETFNWRYQRYYGCGTINSSRHLLMFRSGTAGFSDLLNYGGTGNFGGFRSGCTNNLVAADGILNAPDYTRSCTCSYPLQTSVGMVHMPDTGVEMWTLNRLEIGNQMIRALGINFGAQGNRSENGVLWLEYPKVYGAGPDLPLKIESNSLEWFRNHATWIENSEENYNWVASYGAKGIESISVDLVPDGSFGEQLYTIALYFTEPEEISAGERIFDISIQGEKVLRNFDIVKEAGGARRVVRKEFRGVEIKDILTIELSSILNKPVISGVKIVMDENSVTSIN